MKLKLLEKLNMRTAKIGIIGLGYVGIPIVLRFSDVGFKVVGFDIDDTKINSLNQGISFISHISSDSITRARQAGFFATSNFEVAKNIDVLIICVPTPLNRHREPDLSYITNTIERLLPYLQKGQLIVLESTTYPGTTREEFLSRIERIGFEVGTDFFLGYSPEREDPNNAHFTTQTIPKICSGCTSECRELVVRLYEEIIDKVVPVSSLETAELTKLLENIHRAVNIGLVNEMKVIADRMGIDIHEAIKAAATKPFGFTPYYPGPGLGGHCIPIDPFYLTWKAKEFGVNARFIELAGEINAEMPKYVISKIQYALNLKSKSVSNSKILLLGLAYKKNIDDLRESPALEIFDELIRLGARLSYSDPLIPNFHKSNIDYESCNLTSESVADFDCVVIVTDHDKFDYELILKYSKSIVDTRGVYTSTYANVLKA